jgi:hypothetical protein
MLDTQAALPRRRYARWLWRGFFAELVLASAFLGLMPDDGPHSIAMGALFLTLLMLLSVCFVAAVVGSLPRGKSVLGVFCVVVQALILIPSAGIDALSIASIIWPARPTDEPAEQLQSMPP